MLRTGRLGPEAVDLGGREFRAGDRVLCRRNDSLLGIRNGTRATVTFLDVRTGLRRQGRDPSDTCRIRRRARRARLR